MTIMMPSPSRSVYRHDDLRRLLQPRSLALVGASDNPDSFGFKTQANTRSFHGPVYLVNERHKKIGDQPCYASLRELPEVPDCVVVMVRRELVEQVVLDCAALGVGGAVIYASGFSETGLAERIALQARLVQIARSTGLRLVGPNCIGVVSFPHHMGLTFADRLAFSGAEHAGIGIVSQSGALGLSLFQAIESGARFSHVLTAGNSCDVDVADYVSFLAHDPHTKAIACVIEGLAEPRRMLQAAQIAWDANKPLIIHKMATGAQGAAAALTHTGSLAGSHAGYEAAFERTGAILVKDFEALVETASFFCKAPAMRATGVAVISTSGGASIMAADKAELYGVPLPQPIDSVREILEAHVPEFGSARNPCDVTAQVVSNPASLQACGNALMSDPTFGAVVIPLVYAYGTTASRIKIFSDMAQQHGKAACYVWLSQWLDGAGTREAEQDEHLALFRSMDRCFATLAAWQWREQRRASGIRSAPRLVAPEVAQQTRDALQQSSQRTLGEREAKALLARYGIPVTTEQLTHSREAAATAATALGYPVALKIDAADLQHKTEVGGVRLNLPDAAAVREAYDAMLVAVQELAPQASVNGVLVQPMVGAGLEIVVGGRVDAQFGPLIVVGLGGVLVELMRDTVTRLAPVNQQEALDMLKSLKGAAVLAGFRGQAPVDLTQLALLVVRLSEFLADQADEVVEVDVNPVICSPAGLFAVDALIIRKG